MPEAPRKTLDAEGALVFPTELLADCAKDLEELDELGRGHDPFLVFFEPPSLDERIINQAEVLSAMSDPRFQLEDWLEAHPELWQAWRVPAEVKAEIRERLDQANMNERILLPGLDGLAAWLRRYYSPQSAIAGETQGGATMGGIPEAEQQEGSMASG